MTILPALVVSSPFKFANPSSNEFEFLWEARWWCEEDKRACNPACIFSVARSALTPTPTPRPALSRERERERKPSASFCFPCVFRAKVGNFEA